MSNKAKAEIKLCIYDVAKALLPLTCSVVTDVRTKV